MIKKHILDIVNLSIPRLLGFLDKRSESKTFGCFDRDFWLYKIKDYVNARRQEAMYVLAQCYSLKEFEPFYKSEVLYDWIAGAVKYTQRIMNRDGSYNEVYPNERGFCVSAYVNMFLLETVLDLDLAHLLNIDKLRKGIDWLAKNKNKYNANQMLASVVAIYDFYLLTGEEKYKSLSKERFESIMEDYKQEGCFVEYGGYDLGYETVSLDNLLHLYRRDFSKNIIDVIEREIEKIGRALNEYGYLGRRGSRNTQFIFVAALLKDKNALKKIERGLKENRLINPLWVDDRYLAHFLNDYILAYKELTNE